MSAVANYASAAEFAPAAVSASSHVNVASPAQPRLRITRRGRAVLMTLVAIPIVIAALFFALNSGGAMAGNGAGVALEQVTIEPGQTLWGLAEQYAPHSDPRDFVADVVNLNGIVDVLEAGQVVDIPAKYTN